MRSLVTRSLPAVSLLLLAACRSTLPAWETHAMPNGVVVARTPPGFIVKENGLEYLLIGNPTSRQSVYYAWTKDLLVGGIDGFVASMRESNREKLTLVGDLASKPSACFAGVAGFEISGVFRTPTEGETAFWQCLFVRDGHGILLGYIVPASRREQDSPLVRQILAGTELK